MTSTKNPKIILSRKGFDSKFGGNPSIILPNYKDTVSFPIPSESDQTTYQKTLMNLLDNQNKISKKSFLEVFDDLGIKNKINYKKNNKWNKGIPNNCHLDPDLRSESIKRLIGWRPSLGQCGAALTHLRKQSIQEGDIFIFFGWFRFTKMLHDKITYLKLNESKPSPFEKYRNDLHVCYGYLEVDKIINIKENDPVPDWLKDHPHTKYVKGENAIYVAKEKLSLTNQFDLAGGGTIPLSKNSILTKEDHSRSRWDLPKDLFESHKITYNTNPWKQDFFQSASIGQEFVISRKQDSSLGVSDEVLQYFLDIITAGQSIYLDSAA